MKQFLTDMIHKYSLIIGLTILAVTILFDITFVIKQSNVFHDTLHDLKDRVKHVILLSAADSAITRRIHIISDAIEKEDPFSVSDASIKFLQEGAIFTNAIETMRGSKSLTPNQKHLLSSIHKQSIRIIDARKRTIHHIENENFVEARFIFDRQLLPAQIQISGTISDIKEIENTEAGNEMANIRHQVHELSDGFFMVLLITAPLFGLVSIMMFNNVTRRERILREDKMRATFSATHDSLTGLPNRQYMTDALEHAIELAERMNDMVGYLAMDLNGFKMVNDTLGHSYGDEALIEAGQRISQALRDADVVARFGGDEFSVMMHNVQGEEDVVRVAERIHEAFRKPFYLKGRAYSIGVSIGIVLYPVHANNVHNTVKRADNAMYHCKENQLAYVLYDPALDAQYDEKESMYDVTLLSHLTTAIERDEFCLNYQPKYDSKTLEVVGVEALLRWNNPELGMVPPGKFIKLAEQVGIINDITIWVIKEGMRQLAEWNMQGDITTMSLNVSARCLHDLRLMDTIAEGIVKNNLHPGQITLELTETALMTNTDSAIKILVSLTVLGVKLSIDDFGTGHSSMMYIQKLPVTEIKIDQSFVLDLVNNQRNHKIIKAIIGLAHSIDCIVVAEGVETADDLEVLQDMNCDVIQGYYLARPMSPDKIPGKLRNE